MPMPSAYRSASRTSFSRRRVLQGAAGALAAGAAWPWARHAAEAAQATPVPTASDAAWNELANRLEGRLLREGDPMFAAATDIEATRWAAARPSGIAVVRSARDAATCVAWARETGVPFAVRNGGHSYAGFSTSTGLVINMRALQGVTVDPANGTVTVAGGVNNADFAAGVDPYAVYVPGGRCPSVGVAGLTLGGGWGFSSPHLGMTCDSLVSTEIAVAPGELVTASENENADLFWALRGCAGGNFGVNTSLTYRYAPAMPVTYIKASWKGGDTAAVISALMDAQLNGPEGLGIRIGIYPASRTPRTAPGPLVVNIVGLYWGKEDAIRDLAATIDAVQPAEKWEIAHMPFSSARTLLSTDTPNGTYQLKSGFVRGMLPAAALTTMLEGLAAMPGTPSMDQESTVGIFCLGGKVKSVAPDATAFVHRNADFLFKSEVLWQPTDDTDLIIANLDWLEAFQASMDPYLTGGAYQNFPDRSLANWGKAYYGDNLPRLIETKRRWDPDNLFRFSQSIPLDLPPA